jgi:signal transduction histidine kinase
VLAAGIGMAEMVLGRDAADGPRGPLWLLLLTVAVLTLPLLARNRLPFGAPAAAIVAGGTISFFEGRALAYSFVTFLAVITCSFLFAFLNDRREAVVGLAIVLLVGIVATRNDPQGRWDDYLFYCVIFAAAWLAGVAVNRKLAHTAALEESVRRSEAEAERAAANERARISRELHDVVAHSVSVMTVQASAVRRRLTPEQEREREALLVVEETGRQALAEMRRLLGILREQGASADRAPQPGIGTIDTLVEHVREAGLPVELTVEGEPVRLPPGVDLSAYRIVQEALTNALRHAGPAHAWVAVRYGGDDVEIEVANDGRSESDGEDAGHGLVGMRERVALCGGELNAGPRQGGGFRICARLPVVRR